MQMADKMDISQDNTHFWLHKPLTGVSHSKYLYRLHCELFYYMYMKDIDCIVNYSIICIWKILMLWWFKPCENCLKLIWVFWVDLGPIMCVSATSGGVEMFLCVTGTSQNNLVHGALIEAVILTSPLPHVFAQCGLVIWCQHCTHRYVSTSQVV